MKRTIGTKHIKANDYQNDYQKLYDDMTILIARIEKRFLYLCKRYPEVILYESINTPDAFVRAKNMNPEIVSKLETKKVLNYIEIIEKYIKRKRLKNN